MTVASLAHSVKAVQFHLVVHIYQLLHLVSQFLFYSAKLIELSSDIPFTIDYTEEFTDDLANAIENAVDANNNKCKPSPPPPSASFGFDFGGTLAKTAIFSEDEDSHAEVDKFCKSVGLFVDSCQDITLGERHGRLLFGRVPNTRVPELLRETTTINSQSVKAAGGGAVKHKQLADDLNIKYELDDELVSLVRGLEISTKFFPTFSLRLQDGNVERVAWNWAEGREAISCEPVSDPYPFIVANIGSGVSILHVTANGKFERISGTCVGGATFNGLCRREGVKDFATGLEMALKGDATKCDLLVEDIYGGPYLHLPGTATAAGLGKLDEGTRTEDYLAGALNLVCSNVTAMCFLSANLLQVKRIVVTGSFLRGNPRVQEFFARYVDARSNYDVRTIFLEHEGYLGALGCLFPLS